MIKTQISKIVELIRNASHPKKIILFGSQARGTATQNSDFDILVILAQVTDRRHEMVKLGRLIKTLGIRADILVVSEKTFHEWCDTPGSIYYEAAQEGQVILDEAA